MDLISPSKGRMNYKDVVEDIKTVLATYGEDEFSLIVGTDSQPGNTVCFVTAIIIYHHGKGGRYYYRKFYKKKLSSINQRIILEASYSLEMANDIYNSLNKSGFNDVNIEIHLDVGEKGKSKDIIGEVVNMVTGSGFMARIKPDSYGASKVADKYTKRAM